MLLFTVLTLKIKYLQQCGGAGAGTLRLMTELDPAKILNLDQGFLIQF